MSQSQLPDEHPADGQPVKTPAAGKSAKGPTRMKKALRRSALVGLGILLVGAISLAGAEYYTARPDFCGTCHVMDPYYESWAKDIHGKKIGARCVDCHYAPGEQHTIKAKFKGLSQVASYFSGRYGSARPRAHVADASCMRSGCHGDNSHFSKTLTIGEPRTEKRNVGGQVVDVQRQPSVHFVHEKHLGAEKRRAENAEALKQAKIDLQAKVGADAMARIESVATMVGLVRNRERQLASTIADLGMDEKVLTAAREYSRLEHLRVRLDQLDGLNCSACHAFNATLGTHIAADRQVCYTCHFTNQEFNSDTGECLKCHEPPRRAVQVHASAVAMPSSSGPAPVVMDHDDIVKRKVDCASCHMDVLRGDSQVAIRECEHCHDQAKYLAEFASRTTETVRKYHQIHVANQKAHCYDCHRAADHGLLAPDAPVASTAGFLEPVLNDCQHCHPNHHAQQVSLLTGKGGVGIDHSTPNAMMGSRLNCRACHTEEGATGKGDTLVQATREGCTACHSADYGVLFDQWRHELKVQEDESVQLLEQVRKQLAGAIIEPGAKERLIRKFADAELNINLVRNGGGLHNRSYALQLLDVARRGLQDIQSQINK